MTRIFSVLFCAATMVFCGVMAVLLANQGDVGPAVLLSLGAGVCLLVILLWIS